MNKDQINALRCAYLDLMGAKEAADQNDCRAHDWEAHWETIKELEKHFGQELEGLIVYGEFEDVATDDSRSYGPHHHDDDHGLSHADRAQFYGPSVRL